MAALLFTLTQLGERFDWSELGAIFGVIAGVTAAANAWLRAQLRGYIDQANDELLAKIRSEYPLKEVTDLRIAQISEHSSIQLTDLQRRVLLLEAEVREKRAPTRG